MRIVRAWFHAGREHYQQNGKPRGTRRAGPDEDHGDRGELVVSRLLYQRAEGAEVSYTAMLDNVRGSVAGAAMITCWLRCDARGRSRGHSDVLRPVGCKMQTSPGQFCMSLSDPQDPNAT